MNNAGLLIRRLLRPPWGRIVGALLLVASAITPAASSQSPAQTGARNVAAPAWAWASSDIEPDPAVTYGALPNGMRFALMRNSLPRDAVSIRFDVTFGSLNETDTESGLAHVIEHMAFNGSTHVPKGDMMTRLERVGVAFGVDANAQTSQTHTTYQLNLPKADNLDEALFLLREIASEIAFEPEAIEREKSVILAEARLGDTVAARRTRQQLNFLLPGSPAASRMPIGDARAIAAATRDQLKDLYFRYYRPERATLVVVGDIDIIALQARIRAVFGDWAGKGAGGGDVGEMRYDLARAREQASVFIHKDVVDTLAIFSLSPYLNPPDTLADRRERGVLGLGLAIVNRRLAAAAESDDPPFRSATLAQYELLDVAEAARASLSVGPGDWRRGLEAVEEEWRRALIFGFTPAEVAEQVRALRAGQEDAMQSAAARTTAQLAEQLMSSINENAVFSTPGAALSRIELWTSTITAKEVGDVFRNKMSVDHPLFFLASSIPQPDAAVKLPLVWTENASRPVAPPREKRTPAFAYTDFGSPGRVTSDRTLGNIDARLVTFANNVMLNVKKTEFEPGIVRVSLRVAGGLIGLEAAPLGLGSLMESFPAGGLEAHSWSDLRSILTGHKVQAGLSASPTAFGAIYATTPADLDLQLDVAAAYLVHPAYQPEAERRWRQGYEEMLGRLDASPSTVFASEGARLLMAGDTRFGRAVSDNVPDRTFAELKRYLTPWLEHGAIEIAIVGDIDDDTAISAVARTFGALPARDPVFRTEKSDRAVTFRDTRDTIVLDHSGEPDQATISLYWHVDIDPDLDPQGVRVLSALASIMRNKIVASVREKLGASYTPSASFTASSAYPGLAYFVAGADLAPADMDKVSAALHSVAAELRKGAITDDEFTRAIAPFVDQLPLHETSNSYWLALLSEAQSEPQRLQQSELPALENGAKAITKEQLVAAAQRWLGDTQAQEVRVVPRRTADAAK